METEISKKRVGWVVFMIVAAFVLLMLLIGGCQSYQKAGAGNVILIRNGGPIDSKDIREVRAPETGPCLCGLFSEGRDYYAGSVQRYYKVSSDPSLGEQSGADFIKVPTKDGVEVEVDANIQFHTAFTDEENDLTACDCGGKFNYLVERFDTAFGNRSFSSKSGGNHKVYEGNDGWNAFLDSQFRPVVETSFREQIGSVDCADLISSCSLVQSSSTAGAVPVSVTPKDNRESFERIARNLQGQLERSAEEALGDDYLTKFNVQVTNVDLPKKLEDEITDVQANFAAINSARAEKQKADYQAEAAERKAKAYRDNPILGQLKAVEELKNSNATIILGDIGNTGLVLPNK